MGERIAVIGGGVIGLSVAHELAAAGRDVTVLSDLDPLETTSAVAGAVGADGRGLRGAVPAARGRRPDISSRLSGQGSGRGRGPGRRAAVGLAAVRHPAVRGVRPLRDRLVAEQLTGGGAAMPAARRYVCQAAAKRR